MSLYSQYIKEREGFECIETPSGFATYVISGTECYIRDIYVIPEARQSKLASQIADTVVDRAKAKGCKIITGSVCPIANGSTDSLKFLLAYGMKLVKSEPNMIWFAKEVQ